MSRLAFDEDAARRIDAMYRIGDAVRRRRLVREAVGARPGQKILDVGCGPGYYCAELADEVGPSGSVVGVDGSAPMLALAARRCADRDNVAFHEAEVLALPVADDVFDAAVCVQVLEYVPEATAGLEEMFRALRPGGRLVLWDIDWSTVSIHSEDADLTQRVLQAWDEHLAHPSLPRTLRPMLESAAFEDVRMESHAFATSEFDSDTYGAAIVPFIGTFVAGRGGVTAEEAAAWAEGQRALGERGEFYFACTQHCFTAARPR